MQTIRVRGRVGKYRIEKKIGEGAFATVYQAYDTIEGIRVALKVLPPDGPAEDSGFRREIRALSALDHPNILPLKNADVVDGHFVIALPLGTETLADRLKRRIKLETVLKFADQLLESIAHAHASGFIHCDIKPENVILFPDDHLRLSDFGVAKFAVRSTVAEGSGTGTLAYLAPEQAFGKPTRRSDVFSAGMVIYEMLAGDLPSWPYAWPPVGIQRVREKVTREFENVLARAMALDEKKRFRDGGQMLSAFHRVRSKAMRSARQRKRPKRQQDRWQATQLRDFKRSFQALLETRHTCTRCSRPVSEYMRWCPWCGSQRKKHRGATRLPAHCPRCNRGLKGDWTYCAWCYGGAVQEPSGRSFTDRRYAARCANSRCRGDLLPHSQFCPWCRRKVHRRWKIEGGTPCRRCGSDVAGDYWSHCPWCGCSEPVANRARSPRSG